jgi:hypothetical protein
MANDETSNHIFDNLDPSRRDFVKRVLAGAAFAAPVIATFSIESLGVTAAYAQGASGSSSVSSSGPSGSSPGASSGPCLQDLGYVGPERFEAHVADTSGNTRVNGELVIKIDGDHDVAKAAEVRLDMTKDSLVTSAYLAINGVNVVNIPLVEHHEADPHYYTGRICPSDIMNLCDFDALLQSLASQLVTAFALGTYFETSFSAQGAVAPASGDSFIQIKP